MGGQVADRPAGGGGYGWDRIFIPEGYEITRAQMDAESDRNTYLQIKPFEQLKEFFQNLD